jgi:hypothetical protein
MAINWAYLMKCDGKREVNIRNFSKLNKAWCLGWSLAYSSMAYCAPPDFAQHQHASMALCR